MATDPFDKIPTVDESEPPAPPDTFTAPPASEETLTNVSASAPQRNLLKSATKLAVPLAVVSIFAWIFLTPDQPHGNAKVTPEKFDVDTTKQVGDGNAMNSALKSEAEKAPAREPALMPKMPGSTLSSAATAAGPSAASSQPPSQSPAGSSYTPAVRAPLPGTYAQPSYSPNSAQGIAAAEQANREIADRVKREEEIRSAPLEAKQVRLMSARGGAGAAAAAPAEASGLQAELAALERSKGAATADLQRSLEGQLAGMAPKEQPKQKGANDEFLANTASGSSASSASQAGARVLNLQAPLGRYLIHEGTAIRTVLLTNIKSEMPGKVLARVTADVYDSQMKHVLIPKGSLINGLYNSQVAVGQERLLVAMTKLTLPNGNWIPLAGASATDMMGTAGLEADVNNHFFKIFGSSLIIGASTLMLPRADTTVTSLPGNAGAGGVPTAGSVFASTLNNVLSTLMERNKNIAPTLTQGAGHEFIFLTSQDMSLLPFE